MENVPGAHGTGARSGEPHRAPGGHAVHAVAPPCAYVPCGQATAANDSAPSWTYVPAGARAHAVEFSSGAYLRGGAGECEQQ